MMRHGILHRVRGIFSFFGGGRRAVAGVMPLLLLCAAAGTASGQELVELYSSTFDSAGQQQNWVLSGDWRFRNNSACLQPSLGYTSPATALVFSSTSACAYRNSRIGFATLDHDIAIPINLPKVSLQWWDFVGAELGADFYFVQVSTDGGNTWPHEVFRESADELFWDQETVDLTPFIGETIRIRFGFSTDDTVTNIGWYIDDVHVVGESLAEGVSAVAVNPASVVEGDVGTTVMNFTLTIDPVNAEEIILEHETAGGTAVSGLDFVASSGPVIIPAGASTHLVPVLVQGDAFFEPSETFTLRIGNPSANAVITVGEAEGTIIDDDDLTCLYEEGFETPDGTFPWTIGYPGLQMPEDPGCQADFNAPGCGLKLWHIQTASGCILPAQGGGYVSPTRALVFNRETDCAYDTPGGVLGVVEMISGIPIPDLDALSAQLSFSHFLEIAYNSIQPQAASACVQISTDARTTWTTLRCYGPSEPSDRNFLLPWQEERISLDEYLGEDVFIRFVFEQPPEVNTNNARGWYIDDFKICYAPRPAGVSKVTLGPASAPEGNAGTSTINFPVIIAPPNPSAVELSYATGAFNGANAATPDVDFMTTSGSKSIPAGTGLGEISVVLVGDDEPEAAEEHFLLNISNVSSNVFLVNASAVGTILDDDAPSTFDAGLLNTVPLAKNIPEAAGTVTMEVVLSQARTKAITVNYATRNGTALAGVGLDYLATSGTLTFPPNTRRRTFTLTVLDDTQKEPDETFDIVLTTESPYASNAVIPLTIVDDEPGPVPGASNLSINSVTVTEGSCPNISAPDPCGSFYNAVFTVTLETPNAGDISVDYMTEDGTAQAGLDYQSVTGRVTIPALSTTATVSVPIYADRAIEGGALRAEHFNLVLFNPQGNVNVVGNTGVCTIRDDDFLETAFGVSGSDIVLRDLSNPAEERRPLVGVPLALTAAEFKAFEYNRLYGWHGDRLIGVNLVSGAYTELANHGALTAGDLSGLAWDHTNGEALACSTSGEVLRISLDNGAVLQNNLLAGKKWVAIAVHPTSARIYGLAVNAGAAELHVIHRGTPFTSALLGTINGVVPGNPASDAFWDCDFNDQTGELVVNLFASGSPDTWETRTVQLVPSGAPPSVDSRVRLSNAPSSSIAIATPPPPPSVRWMSDLPFSGSGLKGAEFTADAATNNVAGIGAVISGLGDINGDTFDDFAIGAPLNTPPGSGLAEAGQVFIVFGGPGTGYPDLFSRYLKGENVFNASTFTEKHGIVINGSAAGQRLGVSVSGVGDMNRDGVSEFALGYQSANGTGGVFLVYGTRLLPGTFSASAIGDTSQGASVRGVNIRGVDAGDWAGAAVSGAGDFNGDGFDDLLIGAPRYGAGAAQGNGAAYVVFGTSTGIGSSGALNLQSIAPPAGVRILGEKALDQFGASLSGIGDVNGDGLDDIVIGAPGARTGQGYAVVLFGHPDYSLATGPNPINLARLSDGDPAQSPPLPNSLYFTVIMPAPGALAALYTPQFILLPPYKPGDLGMIPGMRLSGSSGAGLGTSVSGLGDVNGDGMDDFIVGAPGYNGLTAPEPHTGRAYLVLGARGEDHRPEFSGADVGAVVPGMVIIPDDDPIGGAVAGAGDVNGDGLMDILIGSSTASPGGFNGEACVLFGASGFSGTFSLRDLGHADPAAARGFYLYNMASGAKGGLGLSVAPAGDINNDGVADFLLGRSGGLFALLGAPSGDSAVYQNRMRSGVSDVGSGLPSGGGIDLGLNTRRLVGATGNGKHLAPASRVAIEFKNGGVGPESRNPSTQSVTIFRKAAPDVPVGRGAVDDDLWTPAGVHWLLQTDRQGFSESKIELYYRPEEIAGLDPDKLAVFYAKPGRPLSSATAWSWLPFIHDTDRRVFTVSRAHGSNPQAEFNGYYAIIQADLLTYLGGVIPSVGVTPDTVYLYGPEVVPANKAFWHQRDKRLYAVGAGEVRIKWKNNEGVIVSEVRVLNLWPDAATGNYQDLMADTPPVNMNTAGGAVEFKYGRVTESDPTFVNRSNVDGNNVMQDRLFAGGLTRNNDPNNAQGPENPDTTARVLVMLSTREEPSQGDVYFQFIRMVKWNNTETLKGGAAGVSWPVGQHIAGSTSLQYRQFHDEAAGAPYVLFSRAPYAPNTDRYPGFYNREARTGTIVPVNVKRKDESDLVLAFYQLGTRLLDGRTGNRATVPQTSLPLSAFEWPYAATKYNLAWTPTGSTIVIAKQNGTGELDITAYGQNLDVYVQNDPALPGFNPNEEHALLAPYGGGTAMFALRNDLNDTANPQSSDSYTSEPYAMLVYDDPNDLLPNGSPRTKTKPYRVVAEEGIYTFSPWPGVPAAQDPFEGTAGAFINPPYPLSIFAYVEENTFTTDSANFVFEDRTGRHWAKSATGTTSSLKMLFYYPPQPGFYFPPAYIRKHKGNRATAWDGNVPFLDGGPSFKGITPKPVQYQTVWPATTPTMKLGEILIEAKYGLPQINGQCSVDLIYMQSGAANPNAKLIDPVIARKVPLEELPTDVAQGFRAGEISFPLLPPKLDYRVSWDPLARELKFKGILVDPVTGFDYVLVNVMSAAERNAILALSPSNASNTASDWHKAVTALYEKSRNTYDIANSSETPYEVLALTTGDARGTGYVTLAMQNANSCSPLPVSLEILRVVPDLNPGTIAIVKPSCVFDEKLTLTSTLDFAGNPADFEFEWLYVPDEGGTLPAPPNPGDPTDPWRVPPLTTPTGGRGVNEITIEGPTLLTLTDNWFAMRYRRFGGTAPWGNQYSQWTPVQLAPGWIKRVVGQINPFTQRASGGGIEGAEESFATFNADAPNTIVSMISQAGPRFTGSVPLSCDNLDAFGLIPIYETVLNRGAALSIDSLSPINNPQVNTALLLVASRIADLYALLGNEAYADAQDPTIGFGTKDGTYGSQATSIHAFMNQTSSLLEEELTLLRGRDDTFAPAINVDPVYNRLYWNFTTDMTGGEVAYALNYNIQDNVQGGNGVIDEADAKRLYPQGHGDAWGHYLTALSRYYRLLRHPFYTWSPRTEAVLVGGQPVTVDFLDERKFATIAAAKARAGAEIVNLAYSNAYVEDPAKQWQGLRDNDPDRAWGFAEWASRAGQGALVDWAVGNAVLRAVDPNPEHRGIQKIDRTTVQELIEIASRFEEIQSKNDEADIGLNPLGLGTNVIPFDISPSEIDSGMTHFQQIWARAATSLQNTGAAFDNAAGSTQLLRQQNDSIQDFQRGVQETELDFQSRLIEIFGYPYSDDIGPGGLYASGYAGPDLFHYMYGDESGIQRDNQLRVAPYNVTSTGATSTPNIPSYAESLVSGFVAQNQYNIGTGQLVFEVGMRNYGAVQGTGGVTLPATALSNVPITVKYNMAVTDGYFGIKKPSHWTGQRRAPGEIQNARSELIQAVGRFMSAVDDYGGFVGKVDDNVLMLQKQFGLSADKVSLIDTRNGQRKTLQGWTIGLKSTQIGLNVVANLVEKIVEAGKESVPTVTGIIIGFSNGIIIDGLAPVRGGLKLGGTIAVETLKTIASLLDIPMLALDQAMARNEDTLAIETARLEGKFANLQAVYELQDLLRSEVPLRIAVHLAHESVVQAVGNYQKVLAEGVRTLDRREIFRNQTAADVQSFRYRDMAFRIFRNDALQKYRAQFDLAARYTYLAAKAYDYETTMLSTDPRAGGKFLTDIVKARHIGSMADGQPQTGQGLANALAVMARNFDVLSGQLGFNNPQVETNRFSLRHELFRVLPTSENPSDPTWRNIMKQDYFTFGAGTAANLWDVPEFRKYCVPPDGFRTVEPGIVIPFSTTIVEGRNFFGRGDYGALDSSYDSTQFATKIRSVGVWFSNYDSLGLSNTPRIWLVPAGVDYLRSPSSDTGSLRAFNVMDQVLPVPFPIGSGDLASPGWIPKVDTLSTPMIPIRRHGRFRAYHDSGEFTIGEMQRDSRLIGRSVWNSRWMLIIPASTLSSDRAEGLARFVDGRLVNGARNGNGVSDIKIFFETYAFPRLKSDGNKDGE